MKNLLLTTILLLTASTKVSYSEEVKEVVFQPPTPQPQYTVGGAER